MDETGSTEKEIAFVTVEEGIKVKSKWSNVSVDFFPESFDRLQVLKGLSAPLL